jgi:hypothetical protein
MINYWSPKINLSEALNLSHTGETFDDSMDAAINARLNFSLYVSTRPSQISEARTRVLIMSIGELISTVKQMLSGSN